MSTYPIELADKLAPPNVDLAVALKDAPPVVVPELVIPAATPGFLTLIGNSADYSTLWSGWSGGLSQDLAGRPAVFVIFSDVVDFNRTVHLSLPDTQYVKFTIGGDLSIADITIPAGQWWGLTNITEGDGISSSFYPDNVGSVVCTATSDGYATVTATL